MAKKKLAKAPRNLTRRFDAGEDIHGLIEMSKAKGCPSREEGAFNHGCCRVSRR